eukprot:1470502-Rhodomonas_salina.1
MQGTHVFSRLGCLPLFKVRVWMQVQARSFQGGLTHHPACGCKDGILTGLELSTRYPVWPGFRNPSSKCRLQLETRLPESKSVS